MQLYDFQVVYVPGHRNIADLLSRLLVEHKKTTTCAQEAEEYSM